MQAEDRENQLISLAVNLAEEQLRNGTASSQVITHYLKLAATRERDRLEMEKLASENTLLAAKTDLIRSTQQNDELYKQALRAIMDYRGTDNEVKEV